LRANRRQIVDVIGADRWDSPGRFSCRLIDIFRKVRSCTVIGFETTPASRSFAPRIRRLIRAGYECHLVFLWLPNGAKTLIVNDAALWQRIEVDAGHEA
jgi:hypothetical protein